jgi:Tol biopolymer transport system component
MKQARRVFKLRESSDDMKKWCVLWLLLLLVLHQGFSQAKVDLNDVPATITLFGESLVNTFLNERDFAISPDGSEIYFTVTTPRSTFQTIVFCKKDNQGKWSSPVVAPFSGTYSDLEPSFSADGNTLYFASNRPTVTSDGKLNFDIWKTSRENGIWREPLNLGSPVNTTGDEFYPSVAANGNLYYTGSYPIGPGKEDIYLAEFNDSKYQSPVPLDAAVNSAKYEFNAFVSPDETFILFSSFGRKDDSGGGDLYISVKGTNGKWQPARNIKELNSKSLDYCPYVSPNRKALFFTSERNNLPTSFPDSRVSYEKMISTAMQTSNGNGNIYWVNISILRKYFETP